MRIVASSITNNVKYTTRLYANNAGIEVQDMTDSTINEDYIIPKTIGTEWNNFRVDTTPGASVPYICMGPSVGTGPYALIVQSMFNENKAFYPSEEQYVGQLNINEERIAYSFYTNGSSTGYRELRWDLVSTLLGSAITRNISGQNYYDFSLETNSIYLFMVFTYTSFAQSIPGAGVYMVVTETKGSSISDANNKVGYSLLSNGTISNPLTSIACTDLTNYRFRFTLTSGTNNIGILHKIANFS